MSISTVVHTIADTVKSATGIVLNGLVTAVRWSGRVVSSGFNDYLVPAVQAIWRNLLPLLKSIGRGLHFVATKTFQFFRTGYGMGSGLFAAGAGVFAHGFTREDKGSQLAFQVAGVAIMVLGTVIFVAYGAAVVL